jgi:hypothetical protein
MAWLPALPEGHVFCVTEVYRSRSESFPACSLPVINECSLFLSRGMAALRPRGGDRQK